MPFQEKTLVYKPAPPDNPLKGLVPYAGDRRDLFPHSLEFSYLPLGGLVVSPNRYDWTPLEKLLGSVAARGHQAVFRIYIEYPKKTDGIPAFLVRDGLKVHRYTNTNTQPLPPAPVETPDYEDKRLRRVLTDFIGELGRRYDGDPRVGFITAGLLGTWGEWHTYPRSELFASKAVQTEVMDAYEQAFRKTPILLRYPAGPDHDRYADNSGRPFGYHDDSFAWATLETGKPSDDWYYMALLRRAGPDAVSKWWTSPIGGEIRPEAWGKVFDADPGDKRIQNFDGCVKETHVSWLMDSGMFDKPAPAERRARAEASVRKMGYEYHVETAHLRREGRTLRVRTTVRNRGIAPFYYSWPVEFALFAPSGSVARRVVSKATVSGLLPGSGPRPWEESLPLDGLPNATYEFACRVVNPLPNGKPFYFANADHNPARPGWLTLGQVTIS